MTEAISYTERNLILGVDDEASIRDLMPAFAGKMLNGVEVKMADSIPGFMELVRAEAARCFAAVCDGNVHGRDTWDGLQAAIDLKRELPHVEVVLFSGNIGPKQRAVMEGAGIIGFEKPFVPPLMRHLAKLHAATPVPTSGGSKIQD